MLDDLSNRSWKLVNQDNTAVTFPDDFEEQILVAGYIFTNCQGFVILGVSVDEQDKSVVRPFM